jgi:tetratricopeptide (TPR) repeat protein
MQCPQCDLELDSPGVLCPDCGASLAEPDAAPPARPWLRRLLWIGLGLGLFIGALAGAAYLGLYYGERDRETERQTTLQEHYEDGLRALNDGQYELARANFEWVLQLQPDHAQAREGLLTAEAQLVVVPTPTSEAEEALGEVQEAQAAQRLAEAQTAYEAGEWTAAANALTQLRALDADYQQAEVETLLYESLYNAGMEALEEDNLERGVFYLDQAIALQPLDPEAVNQRNLAARYLAALNFWGVDWEKAITEFEELYAVAPNYKDVFWRLYQANLEYGDYLYESGEMCPAELQYAKTLRLSPDAAVEEKRAEAAEICLIATPVPLEGDEPLLTPQPIPGFSVGRLAYPVYNETTGLYDLYALYANGRILRVAQSADQPWWERGTGRVVYRDRTLDVISMILPEEGVPQTLTSPNGRAWPTLSPDGQRMAYAAQNAAGVWTVYVVPTYGEGQPQALAAGWAPAWGPAGLIAYTGCDAAGTTCGIVVDNPDDGQPGTRLTGNENDTAVSWAPGGSLMAYMTNVTGSWDIMLLSTDGGVTQFTYDPSDEGLPTWAPDGSGIAFISNRDGKWAIYIADPNGKNVRRILDLGAEMPGWDNQRLSWSP